MTQPIGEEFIKIRPDASGFRAELQTQISAGLAGASRQVAAAQAQIANATRQTASGIVLPAGVGRDFSVLTAATTTAAASQTKLGTAAKATKEQVAALGVANRRGAQETAALAKNIQTAETAVGRYSRGMLAATAASSGLFRAVSFASGAFLVGAVAGGAAAAAVQEFSDSVQVSAQTAAILRATGQAAGVSAQQVDDLAQSQLRLTGIDDEMVKRGENVLLTFRSIRNEVGAGNQIFTRATKDIQDIASVFGTQLTGSAVQLGKALQDPIRGVTALRRSGITLSQSQRDLIKRLVETGRILTAQKIILGEVERQVGGTAEALGQTLPGRLRILRETTLNTMSDFVAKISESEQVTKDFTQVTGGLGSGLADVFKIAAGGGAALFGITKALADITHAGDAFAALGGLKEFVRIATVAAVALGAVKVSLSLASTAQVIYARVTGAATATALAQATAEAELAVATGTATAAQLASAQAASAAAAANVGLGAGLLRGLANPVLLATVGITALTLGMIKLKQAADNAPGSIKGVQRAIDDLSETVRRGASLQSEFAKQQDAVSTAAFNVAAARRTAGSAQQAQTQSPAQPGSVEARFLANRTALALQALADANDELRVAEEKRDRLERQNAANQQSRRFVIQNTTQDLLKQVAAASKQQRIVTFHGIPIGIRLIQRDLSDTTALKNFNDLMTNLAKTGDPIKQKVAGALEAVVAATGKIPTKKDITIAVHLSGLNKSLQEIEAGLGIIGNAERDFSPRFGFGAPAPVVNRAVENANLREQRAALLAVLNTDKAKLKTLRETNAQRQQELATINETVRADKQSVQVAIEARTSAIEGLADARRGLTDARTALLDTIAQSNQAIATSIRDSKNAVNDAVQSAKSNLDSLGQSVADTLNKFFQAGGGAKPGASPLGARFEALKQQILAGGGGPETRGAAQRIAFELQAKVPEVKTADLSSKFLDLTDALDRGKIKLPQFNRELKKLLDGVSIGNVAKTLGTAAANALRDQLALIRRQARAITGGPQRPGGGTQNELVQPLQAVAAGAKAIATARSQAAKDISGAQQNMADATRSVTRAQRDVQRANAALAETQRRLAIDQQKATKANTTATRSQTRIQEKLLQVEKARLALEGAKKPKPKNGAAAESGNLTNMGAQRP